MVQRPAEIDIRQFAGADQPGPRLFEQCRRRAECLFRQFAFDDAEGELTEERFRAPGALLESIGTKVLRAGEIADLDLGGPIYHRVSNRTQQPLVTLHVYGVAADRLTTGINRIYAEA